MPITEQQRKERINYLGGSDAAAVMGMSRWKTPIQLWAEKTGVVEPEDISGKIQIRVGNKMEDPVAELFAEESKKSVRRATQTVYHEKYQFIAVNLDRRVVGENAFVEIKTASARKRAEWEADEVPAEYLIQVQHGLLVTNDSYAYIGVLFGNEEFIWKRIDRDEELIAMILKKEVEFWNDYVVPKVMPATILAADSGVMNEIYPHQNEGSMVNLPDEITRIVESRQALIQDKASIGKQIDQCDAEIKAAMGAYETGRAGQFKVTWKDWEKKEYTVKATTGRTLRITEAK